MISKLITICALIHVAVSQVRSSWIIVAIIEANADNKSNLINDLWWIIAPQSHYKLRRHDSIVCNLRIHHNWQNLVGDIDKQLKSDESETA